MENETQKKVITIMSVETKATSTGGTFLKLKDQQNLVYNLFSTKKDGGETRAYQEIKTMLNNGIGRNVEIVFNESEYQNNDGKTVTSRNIIGLKEVGVAPKGEMVAKNGMMKEAHENQESKWEELGWKKCKYGFLIESYILGESLEEAEQKAEFWADACQRDSRKIIEKTPFGNIGVSKNTEEIKIEDIPF